MYALLLGHGENAIQSLAERPKTFAWDTSPAYIKFASALNTWKERYLSPLFLEVLRLSPLETVHFDICTKPCAILETYVQEAYSELCERQTDALQQFRAGGDFVVEQDKVKHDLQSNMFAMLNEGDAASWNTDQVTLCCTVGGIPFRFSATNRLNLIFPEPLPAGAVVGVASTPRLKLFANDIQRFLCAIRHVLNAPSMAKDCLVTGDLSFSLRSRWRLSFEDQFLHPQTVPVWPDVLPLTLNPCQRWAADMLLLLDTMENYLTDPTQRTVSTLSPQVLLDFLSALHPDGFRSSIQQASDAVRIWMPRMARSLGRILNMSLNQSFPTLFPQHI